MPESVSRSTSTRGARHVEEVVARALELLLALLARGHADRLDRMDAERLDDGYPLMSPRRHVYPSRPHDDPAAFRQRVPVHVRVGHRGPPGQDGRPDLRRRPRRRDGRGPAGSRGLRDAREHRARRGLGRDHDRRVRGHSEDRPRDDPQDRLQRRPLRVRLRQLRRDHRDRRAVARHRAGRRHGLRGPHRPRRRRRARCGRRGRPGHDVRLRLARDEGAHADADLAGAQAGAPAGRGAARRADARTWARTARRR